ncbi:MAG: regulatory protein RecX, partial [Thermotogota bacterium]
RTEKEIRQRCSEKGFDEEIIEQTVDELYNLNMLDDLRFSRMYIEDGLKLKTKGLFRLERELFDLGVSSDKIKQAIEEVDETDIMDVLKRDYQKNCKNNPEKWQRRMYQRGFQANRIIRVLKFFKDDNFD